MNSKIRNKKGDPAEYTRTTSSRQAANYCGESNPVPSVSSTDALPNALQWKVRVKQYATGPYGFWLEFCAYKLGSSLSVFKSK